MLKRLVGLSAVSAICLFAAPTFAGSGKEPPKEEQKCDKNGKPCKDGTDCSAKNCGSDKKE